MKTITFTCETITPMFLSGADGQTPELRPPSIKGALRFWWRAMNGHLANAQKDGIRNLLKEDERLFGGTNEGGKSSVLVRVSNVNEKPINGQQLRGYAEYDSSQRPPNNYKKSGLAYLYYVLLNQKYDGLEGFDVKTTFDITLSSTSERDLLKAVACFWLFVHLGSVGSRARRGAGAIAVTEFEDKFKILDNYLSFKPKNQENMNDFIKNNLTRIKEQFPNAKKLQVSNEYSTIAPNHIYVSTKDDFGTWQEALNDIGKIMKNLRKGITHRDKSKRTFTMDTLDQKAAFGLPVAVMVKDNSVTLLNNERRSSPIWISIVKNSKDKFQWTIVHFRGIFLESGDEITFTTKNPTVRKKDYSWKQENPSLLTKFINQVKTVSTPITY